MACIRLPKEKVSNYQVSFEPNSILVSFSLHHLLIHITVNVIMYEKCSFTSMYISVTPHTCLSLDYYHLISFLCRHMHPHPGDSKSWESSGEVDIV